jgi:hypothetical protein
VLLTHAHTDRTGFAEQARTTVGARVWIHEHDVQAARTGRVGPQIMPSGLNADTPGVGRNEQPPCWCIGCVVRENGRRTCEVTRLSPNGRECAPVPEVCAGAAVPSEGRPDS